MVHPRPTSLNNNTLSYMVCVFVCVCTECNRAGLQIDLVVILDSSTSIIRTDFTKQIEFVSRLAQ